MVDFSSLPEEVLSRVFRYLNSRERLIVALVCKKWLRAVNCPQLLSDHKIRLSNKTDGDVELFFHMTRQFECFSFHGVVIGDSFVEFLKKYSRQFAALSFSECKATYDNRASLNNVLYCDNLKTLNVESSDVLDLFAYIPNVTELKLDFSSGLTDHILSETTKTVSKLEILSIRNKSSCIVSLWDIISRNIKITEVNRPHLFFSFASIRKLVEQNQTTLRCIDFSNLRITLFDLQAVQQMERLNLRSILFPSGLPASHIRDFCENHPLLTSLDLSSSLQCTDDVVRSICKCLPNLQEFIIGRNQEIDLCIRDILKLEHLEVLDLSYCIHISEASFREAVSNLKTYNLKHLDLAATEISDDSLFQLLNKNRRIRFLNVSETCISRRTVNMAKRNLIYLECLILEACWELSDA